MAITVSLVVEDGTGKADANTFASYNDFLLFWAQNNIDYSLPVDPDEVTTSPSENAVNAALIQATEYINGIHFLGALSKSSQALSFPRSSLVRPGSSYTYPSYIPSDEIPTNIVKATCYLAGLIIQGTDILAPTQNVESQSVSGVGSVTYSDGNGQWNYPRLKQYIGQFVNSSVRVERVL